MLEESHIDQDQTKEHFGWQELISGSNQYYYVLFMYKTKKL
jgi:hypothetical protein